jgi:hypothetical protein
MHGALLYYLIKQSHHPTVHSWGVGTKLCLGLQWCTTVQYYLDDMEVIRGIMIPEKSGDWREHKLNGLQPSSMPTLNTF